MYYEWYLGTWLYDSDPHAASLGCGRSVGETFVATDIEMAVWLMTRKYPTIDIEGMHVQCKDLGIKLRLGGETLDKCKKFIERANLKLANNLGQMQTDILIKERLT